MVKTLREHDKQVRQMEVNWLAEDALPKPACPPAVIAPSLNIKPYVDAAMSTLHLALVMGGNDDDVCTRVNSGGRPLRRDPVREPLIEVLRGFVACGWDEKGMAQVGRDALSSLGEEDSPGALYKFLLRHLA